VFFFCYYGYYMSQQIQTGNAAIDTNDTRGWLIGDFIKKKFGLRHTDNLEIKWGVMKTGEARAEWATSETRTSIGILISGSFIMEFRDQTLQFDTPGDYVMWGPGVDHSWRAPTDAVWLTVRW
jgi:mannose-6-phosphate isomerase-like protein (cupin superfamily)